MRLGRRSGTGRGRLGPVRRGRGSPSVGRPAGRPRDRSAAPVRRLAPRAPAGEECEDHTAPDEPRDVGGCAGDGPADPVLHVRHGCELTPGELPQVVRGRKPARSCTNGGSSFSGTKKPERNDSGRNSRFAVAAAARGRARNAIANPRVLRVTRPNSITTANRTHTPADTATPPAVAARALVEAMITTAQSTPTTSFDTRWVRLS
jgi:hypothetical protein